MSASAQTGGTAVSEPTTDTTTVAEPQEQETETSTADTLIEQELLVEDVSIDGMCGVY
jgi:mycofactocin precursor